MLDNNENTYSIDQYTHFAGIKFNRSSRAYFFGYKDFDLKLGDRVIVETVRGLELGSVAIGPFDIKKYNHPLELKPIIRLGNESDEKVFMMNEKDAKFAQEICIAEAQKLQLDMNIISCEYTLDRGKVVFSYLADDRVDFRELLKVLAPRLHTRIELRQIGSRDRAKMTGGLGICGQVLCCSTFLNEFDGISINRAKNQMLAINVPKLSGQCGKLICCLKYEDDVYTEERKKYPPLGSRLTLDNQEYTLTNINIISGVVKIENEDDVKFIPFEDLKKNAKFKKRKEDE